MSGRLCRLAVVPAFIVRAGAVLCSCSPKKVDPVGEWQGTMNAQEIKFFFDLDGYAAIVRGTEVAGGRKVLTGGRELSMKYSFDFSKKPVRLDLTVYDEADGSVVQETRGIVSFKGPDNMTLFVTGPGRALPESFESIPEKALLSLTRAKKASTFTPPVPSQP